MKTAYLSHIKYLLILFLIINLSACSQKGKMSNLTLLSKQIPVDTALVFAPGVISTELSHESAIAFNQDMTELYLSRRKPNKSYKIYTMKFIDGKWSEAELASFYSNKSEKYSDYRIRLNPQGDKLYFNSDRPLSGDTTSSGSHQWYIQKNGDNWGQPILLEEPASDGIIVDVASSKNGTLYFSLNKKDGKPEDEKIYFSTYQDGQYTTAQEMGTEINSSDQWTCCPFIAPDESYMIYDSPREGTFGWVDLYISFNKNGQWTKSYNLGPTVNSKYGEGLATVSPDEKYLFFYRDLDGKGDIYWADFAQLKEEILEKINYE
jgi:Tol biopolymer transport system component